MGASLLDQSLVVGIIQVDTHLKTRVRIPARDYDIEYSEVEILCRYSNSRAPGDMCRLRYRTDFTLKFYIQ